MKLYRSKQTVQAEQYLEGSEIECIKIGKTRNTGHWSDRFDDTPDGPYVQGPEYKYRIKHGDWVIIHKNGDKYVMTNEEFENKYYDPF